MKKVKALPKSVNRRKICLSALVFVIIILSGPVSFALDPLGPPAANLERGQHRIGIDYSQSKMDLQITEWKGIQYIYGAYETSGTVSSPPPLKDLKQRSDYINLGYSVYRNWDIFLRLSRTKAEFGDSLWQQAEEFESESVPMYGGGIKATFYEGDYLKIGGLVQANWAHYDGQLDTTLWETAHYIVMDFTEIQIALGASYMLLDGLSIYGGPLMHLVNGEIEETYVEEADIGGLGYWEWTSDIKEDSTYGGYIGSELEIGKKYAANIEYQFTGGGSAFCAGFIIKF